MASRAGCSPGRASCPFPRASAHMTSSPTTAANPPRPLPVRSALVLLWSALAIMVAASVSYYASSGTLALVGEMLGHLLGYALLAMLWLGLGAGNRWARALFVIFLAWNLVLTALNLLFESGQLPWLF